MQHAFVCPPYPLFLPLIHSTAASLALLLTVARVGQRSTSFLEFKTITTSSKSFTVARLISHPLSLNPKGEILISFADLFFSF